LRRGSGSFEKRKAQAVEQDDKKLDDEPEAIAT
jgi:hypothetical protein